MISIGNILDLLDLNNIKYSFQGCKKTIIEEPFKDNYNLSSFYFSMSHDDFEMPIELLISRFKIVSSAKNFIITKNAKHIFYFILSSLFYNTYEDVKSNSDIDEVLDVDTSSKIFLNVELGKNSNVGPFSVLGDIGFSYYELNSIKYKVKPFGKLIILDYVDIGKSCVIDRGNVSDTIIGDRTKIDSFVYIAHDVKIGNSCIITSGVKINGFAKIGNNCYLGSGCIIRNSISLGNNITVGMGSIVTKSFGNDTVIVGNPAIIISHKCACGKVNFIKGIKQYTCTCGEKFVILKTEVLKINNILQNND